ncbi:MAG: ATP-binding cassette domain-containing protein [Candidatus Hodarchaeota archaeon]
MTISYKLERHVARKLHVSRIFTPLAGINLELLDNEFLSISGPNGSGKTSLLKVMSGLMRPFNGKVYQNVTNFGFVSQNQILLPELSIKENILLPFYLSKEEHVNGWNAFHNVNLEDLESKVELYVRRFKIEHLLEKHPETCSVGQQQRALLARALILDCDIIFADEPEQNLDSDGRIDLFNSFREVHKQFNKTIVLVTQEHPDVLKTFVSRSIKISERSLEEIFKKKNQ